MIKGLYKIFDHWHKGGTVWILSDTHFGDPEPKEKNPNRPSDDELVKMINSKVGKKDTLILLGDVGEIEYAKKLRGYKVLVCGNHDAGGTLYQRVIQKEIFDVSEYTKEQALAEMKKKYPGCKYSLHEAYEMHMPFVRWVVYADNMLFDEVYNGPLMIAEKIILSHEPIPGMTWAINIHGHMHAGRMSGVNYLNACCDVCGYIPMNFNQMMKNGVASKVQPLHRSTIDNATKRKKKREAKKYE